MEKKGQIKNLMLKIMRFSVIQLLIIALSASVALAHTASAQDVLKRSVSLHGENQDLKTVLQNLEKAANVTFTYRPRLLKNQQTVSVNVQNQPLVVVLDRLFKPIHVGYEIVGSQVILTKSPTAPSVSEREIGQTMVIRKPAFIIKGSVTDDATKAPIVGASIVLKGSAKGVLSDEKGNFTLPLDDKDKNGTLVISFVGYELQTVAINGQTTINIALVEGKNLEEVVVTGVFDARTRLQASSAISIMKTKDIERVAATSAADYLKNIPGVFVDASAGETRNTITTRGLTLFPSAAGYNYVSMQEDGLPLSNFNYGTDNFLRPDVTTGRIEALRGGSATVTGANAPGGIFNYISKTGGETLEGEVRTKFGLEGDGKNPFYRADLGIGGPLSADKSLRFYAGGFLRYSDGARYPGYAANNGGQLKANVTKTYKNGNVKIFAKYLNDHNSVTAATPSENWQDQKLSPGFNYTDSYDVPSIQEKLTRNGETIDFDSRKKHHSKEGALGFSWTHNLAEGLQLKFATRYSDRNYFHNGTTIVGPSIPTTSNFYTLPGLAGRYGVYTLTDKVTGKVLGTFDRQPGKPIVPGTSNSFPGINNQVLFMSAFMSQRDMSDFSNQLSLSKKLDKMSFTVGGYYAKSHMSAIGVNTGSGPGAATMENIPHMIDIKLASNDGKTYQVTSPGGHMKIDEAGQNTALAKQDQYSLFFAHEWNLAKGLTLDWGVRYENVKNYGWNAVTVPINTTDVVTFGGVDGNPLTLYDNFGGAKGPELNYTKYAKYFAYSAALNYKISDNQAVYVRISDGGKSADVNTFTSLLNTQFNIDNTNEKDLQQHITQFEFAYKYSSDKMKVFLTPFYTKLSNVANVAYFRNVDNTAYAPPIQFNEFVTKGIEIEADIDFTKNFGIRASALFQKSNATKYTTWIANANGPADDVLLNFSGNKTGGVPPVMLNIAPRFTQGDFFAILSYNSLSRRPANTPNGFEMKGFNNVDFSAGYKFSKSLSLQLNVNNVLNSYGVTGWLGSGGFPTSLNRDRITPQYVKDNPNDTFSTTVNMPRAYFLTASYKF